MPPGEFSSPDLSDWRADDGSVGGSYLPSGFVGQPVGIDQVGDVWIGDRGATTHMTRNADLMYDTKPGFQQCLADACVFRLVEEGRVAIIAVVHVDDIFAVGLKSKCDLFRDELNRMVPVKNLGELRWYGGCHYTREREMGTLTISQKTFADELMKKFCVTSTQSVPLRVGVK